MEFQGTLVQKTGQREGDNSRGHWVIASYLIESEGMYPKRMACDVSNSEFLDNIGKFDSMIGKRVVVRFDIDAHEWQGKWFNSIRGIGIKEDITDEERQKRANERKAALQRRSGLGTIETPEGKIDANAPDTVADGKVPPFPEKGNDGEAGGDGDLPF